MTTLEFAQKITDIIDARPRRMDLDALLYEINICTKGVPTKHVAKGGWETYEQAMKEMWKLIYSKLKKQNHLKIIKARL